MDSVRKEEILEAPVAITPGGSWIVLHPEKTLNSAMCSTIDLDLIGLDDNNTDGNSEESSKEGFRKQLINNPYKFSYHILVAPSPGITFEDAIKLCGEQQMFLGIIVNEDQNEMVT